MRRSFEEEFQRGDWDYRHYSIYDRATEQGWTKLAKLSERLAARELLKLPIYALQALVKRVGMSQGAYASKKSLSEQLVERQQNHLGRALALPLGRLWMGRSRQVRSQSRAHMPEGDVLAPGAQVRAGMPNARQDPGPNNPQMENGGMIGQQAMTGAAEEEA